MVTGKVALGDDLAGMARISRRPRVYISDIYGNCTLHTGTILGVDSLTSSASMTLAVSRVHSHLLSFLLLLRDEERLEIPSLPRPISPEVRSAMLTVFRLLLPRNEYSSTRIARSFLCVSPPLALVVLGSSASDELLSSSEELRSAWHLM